MKDNWFNRTFRTKALAQSAEDKWGWTKVYSGDSIYGEFKGGDYENAYPSVTKITNKIMEVKPYSVNEQGDKIETPTVLDLALSRPNDRNSPVEFREALGLMYLVHPKSHILVYRRLGGSIIAGGKITPNNIGGFAFLENPVVTTINGVTTYQVNTSSGESRTYTDMEVITLRGLNPYAINSGGYSPTLAAKRWTTIDDYIATYQQGFFKNGAIPAGEFVITAPTQEEFNNIVDAMQAKHRGSGKNNNIVYNYQPIDPTTGKPAQAGITWTPYAQSNNQLSLQELFDQANKKIDSAFGVPASVRGVGENNNFATARTDQQNFMENVVQPTLTKIWSGFTHELNRITGGLGYALDYDLEIPALADEEKVIEEKDKIRDDRIQLWLDKGYTIASIKEYLETGDVLELKKDTAQVVVTTPEAATRTNPKAEIRDENVEYDVERIEAELVPYENDIASVLTKKIEEQVKNALMEDTISEDDMTDEIVAIIILLMALRGTTAYSEGTLLALQAGISLEDITRYTPNFSDADRKELKEYIQGFNEQTVKDIAEIKSGNDEAVINTLLAGYIATQAFRIERFAQNEAWKASEKSSDQAYKQLDGEISGYFTKRWIIQPGACQLCTPMANETVRVTAKFSNGLDYPPAHVKCRCTTKKAVVKMDAEMSIKEIHCGDCDRFLGETAKSTYKDKLKCGTCKALAVPVIK